jgi:hypothetical protein
MSFSINVTVDTAELERIAGQLDVKTDGVVRVMGEEVAGRAISHAPVDTGALVNSIRMDEMGPGWVRVAPHVEYAIYQELGFHHYKSGKFIQNPFLVPAVEEVAGKFLSAAAWAPLFE